MDKVLVYMANGLGNCVLAIPALKSLQFLGYDVDLAIPHDWPRARPLVDLFRDQDFVDGVLQEEVQVNSADYHKIFIPDTYEKTALRSFLESFEHSMVVRHPHWKATLVHESEFLMAMPRSLGYRGPAPADVRISTAKPMDLPAKPYLTLAFSCLDGYPWSLKRWPLEYWGRLLSILLDKLPDHEFVLIGGKGDADDANAILASINSEAVRNYCGHYSVRESAYVLSRSRCLIAVDNGISHLAAASGLDQVVVLYGPTLLSKNVPIGANIHVLRSDIDCSPCFDTKLFRKCTVNECLRMLCPEDVADYVMSILIHEEGYAHGCLPNM